MSDYASILTAARSLSPRDRLHLIDALWDELPADAERDATDSASAALHPEWQAEIERRVAELKSGTVPTIAWEEIRAAALARLENGRAN